MTNYDLDKTEVERLTPEACGASQSSVDAAKQIIMMDGLAIARNAMRGPNSGSFDVCAFTAHIARIIELHKRSSA